MQQNGLPWKVTSHQNAINFNLTRVGRGSSATSNPLYPMSRIQLGSEPLFFATIRRKTPRNQDGRRARKQQLKFSAAAPGFRSKIPQYFPIAICRASGAVLYIEEGQWVWAFGPGAPLPAPSELSAEAVSPEADLSRMWRGQSCLMPPSGIYRIAGLEANDR
jgi:hypothetical protein